MIQLFVAGLCAALALGACSPSPAPVADASVPAFSIAEAPGDTTASVIFSVSKPRPRRFLGFLGGRDANPVEAAAGPPPVEAADQPAAPDVPAIGPSMSDAEIAAAGRVAPGTPEASRRPRLFGFLNNRTPGEDAPRNVPAINVTAPPVETGATEPAAPATVTEPSMSDAEIAAAGAVGPGVSAPSTRPRFLGFLNKRTPGQAAAPVDEPAEAPVVLASIAPQEAVVTPEPKRGGLFSRRRNDVVPNGAVGPLPFGEVLQVCGVKQRDMGTAVARSQGSGTYRLFDTSPTSTQPRTQYLTGFKDGCARQFTGSLALFGAPVVHEATRYDRANTTPYSATDAAYEKIKNRICGVSRGQPCPDARSDILERQAAFVTVYPSFGGTNEWLEIFLHKGQLVTYETRRR